MTPELAQDIYYEYAFHAFLRMKNDWTKPVIQHEGEMEAWTAVIDHIKNDSLMDVPEVKEAWDKYLETKRMILEKPWAVSPAWDAFLSAYERAREERE